MSTTWRELLATSAVAALGLAQEVPTTGQDRAAPVPRAAIAGILDAFRTHDVVMLPNGHDIQQHAFLRTLVEAPGFADVVNDLVVEFGNARYQDLVDRYTRGDSVPLAALRPVWQDQVTPNQIWADDALFATVRAVNRGRPPARQIRILLGDPPIDWAAVKTREDHFDWLAMRDSFPAALIQVEVLARRRKALVVYGALHSQRRQIMANYEMADWQAQTIASLLERSSPTRVFTIWGISEDQRPPISDLETWTAPSLATTRGTTLGAEDFALFVPNRPRMTRQGDALVPLPRDAWRVVLVEEQVDAVLYLGPTSAMTEATLPARACASPGFLDERLRRIALTGLPSHEADRLRTVCGATATRR